MYKNVNYIVALSKIAKNLKIFQIFATSKINKLWQSTVEYHTAITEKQTLCTNGWISVIMLTSMYNMDDSQP